MDFINSVEFYWLIAGIALFALEIKSGGVLIVFMFLSLGAFTTLIAIISGLVQTDDYLTQTITFIISSGLYTALLWKKLRKTATEVTEEEYNSMAGRTAVVIDADLEKGKTGKVKWSGTFMKAKIDRDSAVEKIAIGTEVSIKEVKGNTIIVDLPHDDVSNDDINNKE